MRGALRAFVASIAALTSACAHRPPPALHSAHLIVRSASGGLRAFARAKVAGQPAMLLVDTGAAQSIVSAAFVRAHGLRWHSSERDERILDANGNVARMPVLPDVPVQFDGESSGGTIDFLMSPSGGVEDLILAPQDLVRPGWAVVIDLGREELRYEREEDALRRLGGNGSSLREVDFHRCLDEGLFNKAHRIVPATINGVRAEMLVDTGAELTVLARNNPALPSMVSTMGQRGSAIGVTSIGQGLLVDGVQVVFAKTSFVMPTLVLPVSNTCAHGLLGADLLRHCALVWGWSSLWAACRAPAQER